MSLMDIVGAIQALVTAASGQECGFGQPRDVPGGNDTWVESALDSVYVLGESGGASDETLAVAVVTVTTVIGDPAGKLSTLTAISARAEAVKAAIESDVTLGGTVQQARVTAIKRQPVPASANTWASGARIEIEVKQW